VRGSGIGLSLVKHIAESHGGTIQVKSPISEEVRGCAFELSIPVDRAAPRAQPSPLPASPPKVA
jgi:two-component system phosphate regulon sensor histidine kinase PhoR